MVFLVIAAASAVVGLRYANLLLLDQNLVDIDQLPDSVSSAGFSLSSERELEVRVTGADQVRLRQGDRGALQERLERIWVVDAATKGRVWDWRSDAASHQEKLTLPEGQYVLFATTRTGRQRSSSESWVSWLERDPIDEAQDDESDSGSRDFRITVIGKGRKLSSAEAIAALEAPVEAPAANEPERTTRTERASARSASSSSRSSGGVFVDLTRLEDDEAKFGFFSLSRRTDVRIYAIGEGMNGEMYDYGWIVNTANGRTVWEMRYRDTEHAGGDGKNRLVDTTLSLRRGNYVVYFVTDDSHSYDDWNAGPPRNEGAWGIRVSESTRSDDREDDRVRGDDRWRVVAQLTGIRDDMRRSVRIALDRRSRVRVYAIGEGMSGEMYDYAWVEDADTRNTIWRMRYQDTEHAGGARKNRVIDATGWLPAGEYILRYESDGSHSPESWNADPPDDTRNYGVTVFLERR